MASVRGHSPLELCYLFSEAGEIDKKGLFLSTPPRLYSDSALSTQVRSVRSQSVVPHSEIARIRGSLALPVLPAPSPHPAKVYSSFPLCSDRSYYVTSLPLRMRTGLPTHHSFFYSLQ
ncbi:hypothetical protein J6590_057741 [Homalodisca vitripennis]|nr:hypothetical protein J6590_057741 [Homalodisca vitripennis]